MYPSIHDKDLLIINQLTGSFAPGDIVVINCKEKGIGDKYIIKRIIATEGQQVEIDYSSNSVYVDGEKVDEYYINYDQADPLEALAVEENAVYEVPIGHVFVMGDNRNISLDSRNEKIGMISVCDILGGVWIKISTSNVFSIWGERL